MTGSVTADFDGDGYLDLATLAAPDVNIHFGTGHGTFQRLVSYTVGPGSVLALANLNGDRHPDLVVSGNGLTLLENRGDGTFTISLDDPTLSYVQLDDVDGDGDLDIVAGDFRGNLVVRLNDGRGEFGAAMTPGAPALEVGTTAVGDVNGDGKSDIVYGSGSALRILLGHGDGTFGESPHAPPIGHATVILADVDGDGSLDIVAKSILSRDVHVLVNDGRGVFKERTQFLVPAGSGLPLASQALALAADVNCDDKPDLFFVGSIPYRDDVVSVFINRGDGTFGDAENYAGQLPVATGDFNGDGRPDLVTGWFAFSSVLPNLGDGTFLAPGAFRFPPLTDGTPAATIAMTSGDLNGDGTLDFAVVNRYSDYASRIAVLLGDRTTGFKLAAKDYPLLVPSSEYKLASGDMDGDGRPDLALLNGANTVPMIEVYLSRGSGVFSDPIDTPAGSLFGVTVFAAGDLDNDGAVDLVTEAPLVAVAVPGVNVWINQGHGTFAQPVHYDTPVPSSLTVRDLNGDGALDIVVTTNVGESDGRTLLNKGNGTFSPLVGYPSANGSNAVAIEDVDRDGKADLVTAGDTAVRVLRGFSNGTFANDASYTVTVGTKTAVVARDFDGDGTVDLAIGQEGLISLFRNRGDGTFTDALTFAAPGSFGRMSAIRFDEDEREDIVTFGSVVTLLHNNGCLR